MTRATPARVGAVAALAVVVAVAWLGSFPPMAIVLSPSMEPDISTGDVVLLRSLRGKPPSRGDVVVVPVPPEVQRRLRYPDRLVHRVVEVTAHEVRTKGDNLEDPDPFTVRPGDVRDRVLTVVPGVGRVVGFLRSPFGIGWLALGILLAVGSPLLDRRRSTAGMEETLQELVRAVNALQQVHAGRTPERSATEGAESRDPQVRGGSTLIPSSSSR